MLHIVLFEPEIPPNTGNIIRLCANTGVRLHLIEPLGFHMEHQQLRRAGLDYREFAEVKTYACWDVFAREVQPTRVFAMTTKGNNTPFAVRFAAGDALVFGPESRGLPSDFLQNLPQKHWLRLPMQPDSRSLNLSNAVAVSVYEAWRQRDFAPW
ncbi:MAG: tRNA (uridine(34)/cytosine(34)/5-carboxymethylaminomethyluridine(34)-2'-O)-methyltransferase TrmL [Gammaproteobacteria bacterium 28-57-27]|nr:MAG: tRNA (uridine(34)/cytosine(34)/5-carboxymethylaminomethyluridine(34)-2'-O)-methyltransferase TrmL [Gammaproteobacteria bacterium 28-57-27]